MALLAMTSAISTAMSEIFEEGFDSSGVCDLLGTLDFFVPLPRKILKVRLLERFARNSATAVFTSSCISSRNSSAGGHVGWFASPTNSIRPRISELWRLLQTSGKLRPIRICLGNIAMRAEGLWWSCRRPMSLPSTKSKPQQAPWIVDSRSKEAVHWNMGFYGFVHLNSEAINYTKMIFVSGKPAFCA